MFDYTKIKNYKQVLDDEMALEYCDNDEDICIRIWKANNEYLFFLGAANRRFKTYHEDFEEFYKLVANYFEEE